MFGFGKKKTPEAANKRPRRVNDENTNSNKAQINLFGVPGDDADLDNDDDIEDELLALLGEDGGGKLKKPKSRLPPSSSSSKGTAPTVDPFAIPNFESGEGDNGNEDDDDDDDIDDPDLEAELGELTGLKPSSVQEASTVDISSPVSVNGSAIIETLQERLNLYEKAKASADAAGEKSRSRRFARGIETLGNLLKKAKGGKAIDEAEIPPLITIGNAKPPVAAITLDTNGNTGEPVLPDSESQLENVVEDPPTSEPASQLPDSVLSLTSPQVTETLDKIDSPQIDAQVERRLQEYKRMAIAMKRSGDSQRGLQYLKLAKGLEAAIKSGFPVDLSNFPPIPDQNQPELSTAESRHSNDIPTTVPAASPKTGEDPQLPSEQIFGPEIPKTVMEALQQRLDKYKSEVEKANSSNNPSKVRRMNRIVKQYEEAIMLHKKGKPVPFDDLPTPPGFAPIPIPGAAVPSSSDIPAGASTNSSSSAHTSINDDKSPVKQVPIKAKPEPDNNNESINGSAGACASSPAATSGIMKTEKSPAKLAVQERQLAIILGRQKQFKEAALNAKKKGDIDQAREFLRIAKGLDTFISANQSGLPVDINILPSPPGPVSSAELEELELIAEEDVIQPSSTGDLAEIFSKLEDDLQSQMTMCMRMRDHCKSIGDVPSANEFEKLALESKSDFDRLRLAARQGTNIPKYHYETRTFSVTECNSELTEDEIEISVIQGVNYRVANPTDLDTYVKVELPYPTPEGAQVNKTTVIKNTNNPAYNATFKMKVNRSARNFQRFIHRHNVKLEVWSKGGLLSSCGRLFCCRSGFLTRSQLIGTAQAKLCLLENKCTVHDAFDILDGRKNVGKLEVKLRLRDPVLGKEITQKTVKWLTIDRL